MGCPCLTNSKYAEPKNDLELKALLLCDGFNADKQATKWFAAQNPSNTKRGGLSSGAKMKLPSGMFVNAPLYKNREAKISAVSSGSNEVQLSFKEVHSGNLIQKHVGAATILSAPTWYEEFVDSFRITQIITAHNRQLASAVFEGCALFGRGDACPFCVINYSLSDKDPRLVLKSPNLYLKALKRIPVHEYDGLALNGGLTLKPSRGIELIEPVVRAVHERYPNLPIAVEITPPTDMAWIDRLQKAGAASLMMNLETWDLHKRAYGIPGKNELCPRDQYIEAFKRGIKAFGPGKISTCFVVGTEGYDTLLEGIREVTRMGVIPSPLAGRYFEDVPNYPFKSSVYWEDFLRMIEYTGDQMAKYNIRSTDRAGCVACGMCDLIRDLIP